MLTSRFYILTHHTRVNSPKLYKLCNCKHIEAVPINKGIDRRHKQIETEAALSQPTSKTLISSLTAGELPRGQDAYAQNSWQIMRGHAVVDALKGGADPDGGFLVPDELENRLIQKLQKANVLRTISCVIQTNDGKHKIPVVASEGTVAWLEEEATYTESNIQFSQAPLDVHKLEALIKVSEKLPNDSAFDLMSYISSEFDHRLNNAEEQAFLAGSSTGQPTGILTDINGASARSTTAKADTLTFDDLIDLLYSLKVPYRQNAVFPMNDNTVGTTRKMKNKNDQYI